MSAGVILVDPRGRVLMQLRDDDPSIMFPNHWGLTGGAAHPGETPEQAARREVEEETGLRLGAMEPFRAYYFRETGTPAGAAPVGGRRSNGKSRADYELYLYHAPCRAAAEDLVCGEGRELRFFSPDQMASLDIAYNHRDVLADFFASPVYAAYVDGRAFSDSAAADDPVVTFLAELDGGAPWFPALMRAIASWGCAGEVVEGRSYGYLVGGEAFDWLLLAERLLETAGDRVPQDQAMALLFGGEAPSEEVDGAPGRVSDERLRELVGEAKHRAHLNYLYGITVEEALQYAVELEVTKERVSVNIKDARFEEGVRDPVYDRIYGRSRAELVAEFRAESGFRRTSHMALSELRHFLYWLFQYRVKTQEPARVASDTRKALAQLSQIELAARRRRVVQV
jgi:8-oxo-dGTP pyrophosphatase MutT (NUDIX family)